MQSLLPTAVALCRSALPAQGRTRSVHPGFDSLPSAFYGHSSACGSFGLVRFGDTQFSPPRSAGPCSVDSVNEPRVLAPLVTLGFGRALLQSAAAVYRFRTYDRLGLPRSEPSLWIAWRLQFIELFSGRLARSSRRGYLMMSSPQDAVDHELSHSVKRPCRMSVQACEAK